MSKNSFDILVFDVGSTYTKVTAFSLVREGAAERLIFLGRSQAPTTVEGIGAGLAAARKALRDQNVEFSETPQIFSSCSAAGGLRMVAMGYMPRVTVKAAKEVAMNSGARVLEVISSEEPEEFREEVLQEIRPDVILLTGGTDGGNTDAILEHAQVVARAVGEAAKRKSRVAWAPVVIIGGNLESQAPTANLLREAGISIWRVPNILPTIHELRVKPAREAIHEQFIRQITRAPGLAQLSEQVENGKVVPTPGAVLLGAELLACGTHETGGAGSLIVVELGGATTDVHSIMPELAELAIEERGLIISNEKQVSYRTVEGNLGMRVSACGIVETLGPKGILALADPAELGAALGRPAEAPVEGELLEELCGKLRAYAENMEAHPHTVVPEGSGLEAAFDTAMATAAVAVAIRRHAGRIADPNLEMGIGLGLPSGRDTRPVRNILAVGGIFTHSGQERGLGILRRAFANPGLSLLPLEPHFIIDGNYQLYSIGVLGAAYPEAALHFALETFGLKSLPPDSTKLPPRK